MSDSDGDTASFCSTSSGENFVPLGAARGLARDDVVRQPSSKSRAAHSYQLRSQDSGTRMQPKSKHIQVSKRRTASHAGRASRFDRYSSSPTHPTHTSPGYRHGSGRVKRRSSGKDPPRTDGPPFHGKYVIRGGPMDRPANLDRQTETGSADSDTAEDVDLADLDDPVMQDLLRTNAKARKLYAAMLEYRDTEAMLEASLRERRERVEAIKRRMQAMESRTLIESQAGR